MRRSHPDEPLAGLSSAAAEWLRTRWTGRTFASIGMANPVLGPERMRETLPHIAGAPAPLEIERRGHFLQEWGEAIARAALAHFGDAP